MAHSSDKIMTITASEANVAETLIVAKAACSYSRGFILKGCTQIINNEYSLAQRLSLRRALVDLRAMSSYSVFDLESDKKYQQFFYQIEQCKKFSLGNCHEMALLALDYVLTYAPAIEAEVYNIKGGDHVFLVIGREKNSDPHRPESWGKEAYICDPWSNKIYPASEYLKQTKNFYFSLPVDGIGRNCLEDFDPSRHSLSPLGVYNTAHLREANSSSHIEVIILLYKKRMKDLHQSLTMLEKDIKAIVAQLEERYPNNPQKKEIVDKMATQIHVAIEKIEVDIKNDHSQLNHKTLRSTLEDSWKQTLHSYQKAVSLCQSDREVLANHHNRNSYVKKALCYFRIRTKTVKSMNRALKNAHRRITSYPGRIG